MWCNVKLHLNWCNWCDVASLRCGRAATLGWSPHVAKLEESEMESWQEQRLKTCFQVSPCYDHRCFRVCTYVCRKAYELYFLYRNLISVFKRHKKNDELKRIYIYMFVCKLRECLLEERREWRTHQHCVEAICWMLKSLCDNVKCWENFQSAPPPSSAPFFLSRLFFKALYTPLKRPSGMICEPCLNIRGEAIMLPYLRS